MRLSFYTIPIQPLGRPIAQSLAEDREAFLLANRLGTGTVNLHCSQPARVAAEVALPILTEATKSEQTLVAQ